VFPLDPFPELLLFPLDPFPELLLFPLDPFPELLLFPLDPFPELLLFPLDPFPELLLFPLDPFPEPLSPLPLSPPSVCAEQPAVTASAPLARNRYLRLFSPLTSVFPCLGIASQYDRWRINLSIPARKVGRPGVHFGHSGWVRGGSPLTEP